METKIKILIGVLIVGVILIGGWWVWNRYFRPVGISGTPLLPKIPIAPVRLTTDKTEYEQGETVKVRVKNNLDKPIYYRDWCGSWNMCGGSSFKLGKKENGEYHFHHIGLAECLQPVVELRAGGEIIYSLDPRNLMKGQLDEGGYKWEFIYGLEKENESLTNTKTIYSNEFTIE